MRLYLSSDALHAVCSCISAFCRPSHTAQYPYSNGFATESILSPTHAQSEKQCIISSVEKMIQPTPTRIFSDLLKFFNIYSLPSKYDLSCATRLFRDTEINQCKNYYNNKNNTVIPDTNGQAIPSVLTPMKSGMPIRPNDLQYINNKHQQR